MRQEQNHTTLVTEPPRPASGLGASALLVAIALGIVYVVWGSTYLAIRVMVEDLPPMASASWRYLVAGLLLAAILAARGGVGRLRATRRELVGCAALGLLLPALGNGLVSVGEHQGAPSGIAALLVAAVPLWVIVYRRLSGDRPSRRTLFGVLLGFAGLVLLIGSQGIEATWRSAPAWSSCAPRCSGRSGRGRRRG